MTSTTTWSHEPSSRRAPGVSGASPMPVGRQGHRRQNGTADPLRAVGNAAVTRLLRNDTGTPTDEHRSGDVLDPSLRSLMEARLGADFSKVRVHADNRAAEATRREGATALTVGQHVLLGADAPSQHSDAGRRLLAHELAHVVQQQDGAGTAQGHGLAEREADAAALAVTAGRRFAVRARTGPTVARQAPGAPAAVSPLTLPTEGVDMPWVGKGSTSSSELGYLRDPNYFWSRFEAAYGNQLSPANRSLIAAGRAPVVDPTWVQYHPQHAAYLGDQLEHHHVGQGSRAVPIPEKLHDAYTVFHPQRRVVGTPAKGTKPLPAQPTRQDTQAEIDRHVREGRIRGPGVTPDTPPQAPSVPVNSEVAASPVAAPPRPAPPPPKPSRVTAPAGEASAVPGGAPEHPTTVAAGRAPAETLQTTKAITDKPISDKPTSAKATTVPDDVELPAPRGRKGVLSTATAAVRSTAEGATAALMGKALSDLNKLAAQNPKDKELGRVVHALNDTLDAESFMANPAGFLAAKSKDAIIQGVFNHFAESLAASRRSFRDRFPDVATLHQNPLHNGVSLEALRQNYLTTLEALRIPAARHAIFYVAALLGLPENASAEEVGRRIAMANRELSKFPGTASYVARFQDAQSRYIFALAASTNDLNVRGDELAALPPGLADDLRRRADALGRISSILDRTQQDLWNSGLVVWVPILSLQQDLDSLGKGFAGLGASMDDFAEEVSGRKGEYLRELDRLAVEARKVAAQSTRAFMVRAPDEAKR